jgi:hypothetical protein
MRRRVVGAACCFLIKKSHSAVFVGGGHLRPFAPHVSEGVAMVGTGGQRPKDLSPRWRYRGEILREDDKVLSPRSSPHV